MHRGQHDVAEPLLRGDDGIPAGDTERHARRSRSRHPGGERGHRTRRQQQQPARGTARSRAARLLPAGSRRHRRARSPISTGTHSCATANNTGEPALWLLRGRPRRGPGRGRPAGRRRAGARRDGRAGHPARPHRRARLGRSGGGAAARRAGRPGRGARRGAAIGRAVRHDRAALRPGPRAADQGPGAPPIQAEVARPPGADRGPGRLRRSRRGRFRGPGRGGAEPGRACARPRRRTLPRPSGGSRRWPPPA